MKNNLLFRTALVFVLTMALRAEPPARKAAIHGDPIDGPSSPAPAITTPAPAAIPTAAAPDGGARTVAFSKLAAFTYQVSDTPLTNQVRGADVADQQIPAEIKALDQKTITITGYLMPLKEENGKSTEFLMMRTQSSCCYGIAPCINELIFVKAAGKGVPAVMDELVQIQGTLHVGTMREDGYIVGIYQMEDAKYIGKADR